jgi:hypothetical protein
VKPKIEHEALDGPDRAPHPTGVSDPKDEDSAARAAREARLAEALRANLRRRKAAKAAPPARNPHEKPSD